MISLMMKWLLSKPNDDREKCVIYERQREEETQKRLNEPLQMGQSIIKQDTRNH